MVRGLENQLHSLLASVMFGDLFIGHVTYHEQSC
jgi:hypothetical protein